MPQLTPFTNTNEEDTTSATNEEETTSGTNMNVGVNEPSYIPNTRENIMFRLLRNTKVSFVVLLIIVVAIYIGIFLLLGNESQAPQSSATKGIVILLEVLLWVMLIVVVYINFKNMSDENYNFQMSLSNLWNSKIAELEVTANTNAEKETAAAASSEDTASTEKEEKPVCEGGEDGKEVFHVYENKYDYGEARDVCDSYDARLASYDELEKAYENGANWCSYGWSKDQLVLFPIQKAVYNNLKKYPGLEYSCGRPGINGGYSHNKKVKFGVNCYGVRPKPKPNDESYAHSINHTPTGMNGVSPDQVREQKQKEYIIAHFNKDKWSRH